MTDPKTNIENDVRLPRLLRWRLHIARLIAGAFLLLEKSLEHLWPAILWSASFASLWLLQIPDIFGHKFEIFTAFVFISGFGYLLWRGISGLRLPDRDDVTRRIEEDSDLTHRPLSGLDDRLANPDKDNTAQLWNFWQSRLLPSLQLLRLPKSRPVLTNLDPYALRGLVFIVLIAAIAMAGPSWPDRLKHGLVPALPSFARSTTDTIILWVTPPDYTGQPQIVLKGSGRNSAPVSISEGSIVKARVKGWMGTPSLAFDKDSVPMEKLGRHSYGLEKEIPHAEKISVRQFGLPRASWNIAYGADLPPTIVQKGDLIIEEPKGEIKVPLTVQDDYSVESLTATIRLDPSVTTVAPFGDTIIDQRNVLSAPQTPMDFTPKLNLAWHPWAGMKVIMDIEIRDHKGQTASLSNISLTLPERTFRHPVAQKLISLRKRLLWSPEAAAKNIAYDLEQIMVQVGSYQGDGMVFLSLRTMASHLYYDQSPKEVAKVIAQLWDTALRLEDGNFSMAQRTLQQAQQALQDALKDPNASPEEIAALMDDLRRAMSDYMREAFREMQKRMAEQGQEMNMLSPEMFANNINPQDLSAFMDRMQSEAMSGNRNAAREMLSQMERLMDMMDPSSMQTEMPKDMQAMMEGLEKLQELIDRQKDLLDQTQAQAGDIPVSQRYSDALTPDDQMMQELGLSDMPPQPQDSRAPPEKTNSAQETDSTALLNEQTVLRKMLGEMTLMIEEKAGNVPDNLGKADQSMNGAIRGLEQNNPVSAVPHQQDALKHLSDSQKQMSEQLAERMKQMMMMSFGMGPTDPLGRPMNEGENGMPGSASKVKIPEEAERKKIHDILEHLRKKSGELQRPEYELDYYRRLMRQF